MSEDIHDDVERELARFRPAALPQELRETLAAGADTPLTFADRVLATFTGMGALAACFILTVCLWQALVSENPRPSQENLAAQRQRAAEFQQMLASR